MYRATAFDSVRGDADWGALRASVLLAAAYYLGARIGFALTFDPLPISILWPPNAILLSALLLAPLHWWKYLLAAAFCAHLLVELQSGVSTGMVLCWFLSNASEALIGALLVRRFSQGPLALNTVHNVVVFFCCAAFAAPFFSSFIDAAFVKLIGGGESGYWAVWGARFISNVLAMLVIVPIALIWNSRGGLSSLIPRARRLEGAVLLAGIIAVSILALSLHRGHPSASTFLYLPLPLLLWAAFRFGPQGVSVGFTIVAFTLMWGTTHGLGPFFGTASQHAVLIQLFLISAAAPLIFLGALIEERDNAERDLRESEDRFATAFHASPDAVLITSWPAGEIIEVNEKWQALFGNRRQDVLGTTLYDLNVHADGSHWPRLADALRRDRMLRDQPFDLCAWSGAFLHTLVSSEAARIAGKVCAITTIRDVTRQRSMELELQERRKQLMHFTRVARLSELSGSLAHELNQPLTAILSNAQAAQRFIVRDPPDLSEIRSILDNIVAADIRAGEVIRGLRLLMKKGDTQFAPTSLNDVVEEVLTFSHSELISAGVQVTNRLSSDLPQINADRVQLQQLLLNLVSNASEAMQSTRREGRRLAITTTTGADGTAHLRVTDSGPGLPQARLQRLFEPFHTTKDHGLGLGLPICRMIIEAHSAVMRAENVKAGGATFHVVFPGLHEGLT